MTAQVFKVHGNMYITAFIPPLNQIKTDQNVYFVIWNSYVNKKNIAHAILSINQEVIKLKMWQLNHHTF